MLAAGIAVGVLTVPIIASVAEDASAAVPMSLREASFGLGAQRYANDVPSRVPAGISGSSPPSSSGSPERSARRWSWPSPPGRSEERCSTSLRSNPARR